MKFEKITKILKNFENSILRFFIEISLENRKIGFSKNSGIFSKFAIFFFENWWSAGYFFMRIQDTSGAGHSPKERSGVDCRHPEKLKKPIFSVTDIRYSLGEVYGGARVCQESCAWGREKSENRDFEKFRRTFLKFSLYFFPATPGATFLPNPRSTVDFPQPVTGVQAKN